MSGESQEVVAARFRPLAAHIESGVPGVRVEVVRYATIDDLVRGVNHNDIEFALTTPSALVALSVSHPVRVLATVVRRGPDGSLTPWMAGTVFVRQDRAELRNFTDARGQRIAGFAPLALGGWLAPLYEWHLLGLEEKEFREVRFTNSYEGVAGSVCSGSADVGVLSAEAFDSVAKTCAAGFRVLKSPRAAAGAYPFAASTPLYPEAALTLVSSVDERLVRQLALAVLSIEEGSPIAESAGLAGFSAPLNYGRVVTMMQELRTPPFETYGRVSAWQAVEQHSGSAALVFLAFLILMSIAVIRLRQDVRERKQMEKVLSESEEKFSAAFHRMPISCSMTDFDNGIRFIDVNAAFERMTGRRRDDVLGRPAGELGIITDPSQLAEAVRLMERDGKVRDLEFEFRRGDGLTGIGLMSGEFIQIGGKRCVITSTVEITDRRRAEAALRESEARLSSIISNAPVILFGLDAAGVFTLSEGLGLKAMGLAPGEVVGRTVYDVYRDQPALLESVRRAMTGELQHTIHTIGSLVYETFYTPLQSSDGQRNGVIGVATDITARKRAEEGLARLATAIDRAVETVVITDAAGIIQYANPSFERTTGYKVAEAIGKTPSILNSGKHDREFYRQMWTRIRGGEVWRGRFQNRRKDGTVYVEDATISPVLDDSGQIVNFIALKLDVTREMELEEHLGQAQKMDSVGRLAGGVAHDFNNLLTVINGYGDLLLKRLSQDDRMRPPLEMIRKAGGQAAQLTQQLLAFSRKQRIEPRRLNLNALIADSQKMFGRLIGEDVELTLTLRQTPDIQADPGQLQQVVMNLLINARDAMPKGGRVTVETSSEAVEPGYAASHGGTSQDDFVTLTVTDTGEGMDEETRAHIFEPFFTTKKLGAGTGLGLAMVYGIVGQSGGWIEVFSEPGRGARFKLYFPVTAAGAEAAAPATVEPAPTGGSETLLVVEDRDDVRGFAAEVLTGLGYRVLTAADGKEALEQARNCGGPLDLLVTDVVMPGLNGAEVAVRLRALRPGVKVLYMSGYPEAVIVGHGARELDGELLRKPFTPEVLAEMVRRVLDSDGA